MAPFTKNYIMLHHSLTKDNATVSWGAIERFHRENMGWRDIGYHYGVELVGDSYYALVGRDVTQEAAACYQDNMNKRAIHICCVGNYDLIPPLNMMLDVLTRRLVMPLIKQFKIPVGNIVGHHDYATYKSCPGKQFDIPTYRKQVMVAMGLV